MEKSSNIPNPIGASLSEEFHDPRLKTERRVEDAGYPGNMCRRKLDRRKVQAFSGEWWLLRSYRW